MISFVILHQAATPIEEFRDIKMLLQLAGFWHPTDGNIPNWVGPPGRTDARDAFHRAADLLEKTRKDSRKLMAIVDGVDPFSLNPLADGGWSSLIAMLILGFPEVRWCFRVISGCPEFGSEDMKKWEEFVEVHGATSLLDHRGSPLFDGYGLRQWILERMREPKTKGRDDAPAIPLRPNLATVLDDEEEYHHFMGHMAYSKGFRVHAMESLTEAVALLGPNGLLFPPEDKVSDDGQISVRERIRENNSMSFYLSIEDWYLNFPDKSERELSDLSKREEVLNRLWETHAPRRRLAPPLRRRFVTVGHEQHPSSSKNEGEDHRDEYLKRLRESEKKGLRPKKSEQVVFKPATGLYTLWHELGLERAFRSESRERQHLGLAPGYEWPPSPPKKANGTGDGHSSPGRLLMIAESLLSRAASLLEDVNTVKEAVRGAVLATQAMELLGCKTPILSLNALSLKHAFEVHAECQFSGVEYHLSMAERLRDVEKNLKAMSFWLNRTRMRDFNLNGEAFIVTRLLSILDESGEYEEAEICRTRLRSLHRQISIRNDWKYGNIGQLLLWPFGLYVDWVLRSLGHFAFTIVTVVLLFTGLFQACGDDLSFIKGLQLTIGAMFTVSHPASHEYPFRVVCIGYFASAFGVLNFGLLITHLYSKMARK